MTVLLIGAAAVLGLVAALLILASRSTTFTGPRGLAAAAVAGGVALVWTALVLDGEPLGSETFRWPAWLCLAAAGLAAGGAMRLARELQGHRQLAAKLSALEEEQRRYVDEASSSIQASRARFRALTEASPLGILEFDVAGACTFTSRRWGELTDQPREVSIGAGWLQAIHPEHRVRVERDWAAAVAGSARFETEVPLAREVDGKAGWGLLLIAPKPARGEDPPGFIGTFADLTEKHRAEDERRVLEERVQRAERLESLGVLAGGVAHDFNNLVVGILGNLEVLQGRLAAGEPVAAQVERVEQAAQRAAELAAQLLAFAGRGESRREPVDLSELVEEMAPLVDHSRPDHVELERVLDQDLPAVEGDPTQLRQIIMNLLTNAFAACADAGGHVVVRTGVRRFGREELGDNALGVPLPAGEYVWLEVEDDGGGIDAEAAERIFDPFFTTRSDGRGLGLAVVLGVVRRVHGSIQVDSEPGRGTRVRVLFPMSARPPLSLASEERQTAD